MPATAADNELTQLRTAIAALDGQRAVLGVVTVGHDAREVRSVLDRVVAFAESVGLAEVTNSDVEVLNLEHGELEDEEDEDDEDEGPENGDDGEEDA